MSTEPQYAANYTHAPTLAELNALYGEGNAHTMVARIGDDLLARGFGQTQQPLDGAVARIMASLAPNDLRMLASGGMPQQAAALINNAVEEAKAQKAQQDATAKHDAAMRNAIFTAALAPWQQYAGRFGMTGPSNYGGKDASAASSGASTGSRTNYQDIAYNSPQSLYAVSSANYLSTPYAKTGMNGDTFKYIQNYFSIHDRAITGKNVIDAARDVKRFGFGPNDKEAVRDQAIIRHYDDKPEETVRSLEKYSKPNPEEQAKLDKLQLDLMKAKTPEARAAAKQAIEAFHSERRKSTGVQGRIDSTPTKKAKDAIDGQGDRIKKNLNNESLERIRKKGYHADALTERTDAEPQGMRQLDPDVVSQADKKRDVADKDIIGRGMDKLASLESPTESPPKNIPQKYAEVPASSKGESQDKPHRDEKPSSGGPES